MKPGSHAANASVGAVSNLLSGIPQSGVTLGNSNAPVTVTEYGDLDCPVCEAFALPTNRNNSDGDPGTGYFDQLVSQYVRASKAKIVYRSLETATAGATARCGPSSRQVPTPPGSRTRPGTTSSSGSTSSSPRPPAT